MLSITLLFALPLFLSGMFLVNLVIRGTEVLASIDPIRSVCLGGALLFAAHAAHGSGVLSFGLGQELGLLAVELPLLAVVILLSLEAAAYARKEAVALSRGRWARSARARAAEG